MDKRLGFVGIIVEDRKKSGHAVNDVLSEFGDLIVGRAMGAYTWASASEFNFFPKATVVSVNSVPGDTGTVMAIER